jgi:raffinose/stachyose/melibiose transport system substrate-binding protein
MKEGSMKRLVIVALALCIAGGLWAQTLKMGDNLSDRTGGWGAVVEQINAEFKQANPGVDFVTESYPDQPYQQKIKIYATAKQLPDVFKYWSFSTLLKPLVDAGFVLELNKADFAKYGFVPGSLESNVWGDKLYGIPVSADFWVIYYNKKLFKDAGAAVPATVDDLMALAPKFKAKGIIPMVTDGKDAWPLSITYDVLCERVNGDFSRQQAALDRKAKFTDPDFVEGARQYVKLIQSGLFQDDLMVSDYGASRNLFGQGKAAMYLMGPWEMGLATDTNFSEEFRANVDAFKFPVLKNGKGKIDDLEAWYGGNYVISSASKYKDLDLKYLKYYAERFPVLAWEKHASFPAQKVTPLESDTPVAKTLLKILADAKKTSGTTTIDRSTPQFKEDHQNFIRELSSGLVTPEEFCKKIEASAEKASKQN